MSVTRDAKRAEKLTQANLAISRADQEIRRFSTARHTPLVKDLRAALKELVDEMKFEKR